MNGGDDPYVPIRTTDPGDEDDTDFAPLTAAIGDARIVMLGEPSHGDGASFRMMDRLIRFLHRRMGFGVLIWENPRWDGERIDAALDAGRPIPEVVEHHLGDCWRPCAEVHSLLRYLRSTRDTGSPLRFAGMDHGLVSPESGRRLARHLLRALPPNVVDWDRLEEVLGALGGNRYETEWNDGPELREILAQVEPHLPECSWEFEDVRFTEDLRVTCPRLDSPEGNSRRDLRMAENLFDFAERVYPEERLIVRAMNGHTFRRLAEMRDQDGSPSQEGMVAVGDHAWRRYGDDVYSICFLAYEGTARWACHAEEYTRTIDPAPPGSVEADLHATGYETVFVNLRGLPDDHSLRGERLARPIAYYPAIARWDRLFDAFIQTAQMYPATPVEPISRS
jgi:erythromycin esterase